MPMAIHTATADATGGDHLTMTPRFPSVVLHLEHYIEELCLHNDDRDPQDKVIIPTPAPFVAAAVELRNDSLDGYE